jgi:hypothetical protein
MHILILAGLVILGAMLLAGWAGHHRTSRRSPGRVPAAFPDRTALIETLLREDEAVKSRLGNPRDSRAAEAAIAFLTRGSLPLVPSDEQSEPWRAVKDVYSHLDARFHDV